MTEDEIRADERDRVAAAIEADRDELAMPDRSEWNGMTIAVNIVRYKMRPGSGWPEAADQRT